MEYLSKKDIKEINQTILHVSQGLQSGVINDNALSMLTDNPPLQSNDTYYPGIFIKAAFYMRTIIGDHVFNDGCKRTALVVIRLFLYKNDYIFNLEEGLQDAVQFTTKIVTDNPSLEEIAKWIEKHSAQPTMEDS